MAIQGRRGTVRNSTYRISGATLEAINAAIRRSGPPHGRGGARRAGACAGTLVLAIGGRDWAFETAAAGSGFRATCTVSGGAVRADCRITLPNLSGSRLSATAQREWDRFLAAVQTHESGHVDAFVTEAEAVAADIAALSAEGEGRDERAAQVAAKEALSALILRIDLEARADAAAARYDSQTRSGESQGAVLDATIA